MEKIYCICLQPYQCGVVAEFCCIVTQFLEKKTFIFLPQRTTWCYHNVMYDDTLYYTQVKEPLYDTLYYTQVKEPVYVIILVWLTSLYKYVHLIIESTWIIMIVLVLLKFYHLLKIWHCSTSIPAWFHLSPQVTFLK